MSIVDRLVSDLEFGWIRGPSVICRDICNLSMTCHTLYSNFSEFLDVLGRKIPECLDGSIDWDRVTRNSANATCTDLRAALRCLKRDQELRVRLTTQKADLVSQIHQFFYHDIPSTVSAHVALAIEQEKSICFWPTANRRIVHKLNFIRKTDWRAADIMRHITRVYGQKGYAHYSLFLLRRETTRFFPNMQSLTDVAWPRKGHKMPTFGWGSSSGESEIDYVNRLRGVTEIPPCTTDKRVVLKQWHDPAYRPS